MSYSAEYDSLEIRTESHDVIQYIIPFLNNKMVAIDLGCGTCRKSIQIAAHIHRLDCIDINEKMLIQAEINKNMSGLQNIRLCLGDNMDVPVESTTYDLCTAFLTTWSPAEAHRLLCKDGLLVIESLCSNDKIEMKTAFGKDEFGWRGRYLNQSTDERLFYLKRQISSFFNILSMKIISFDTILTRNGLIKLLLETPTIRNFSLSHDEHIIDKITQDNKIKLFKRRVIIIARSLNKEIKNDK
jgi:SAM-dependent methyltransferase